ncbi:MAG: phosphoglycerate dehydrogenase, partial [Negativicutes bacterium]|nr:phosphoglycerate dehydrogenase [Negativicutes bacterium]
GVDRRMLAMEMKVLGFDPFISGNPPASLGIELASIDRIFAEADFITLHLPLNGETKNLVDRAAIAKMKPSARLINCARGGIVNEADLAEALNEGRLAGAAVDVFEEEPVQPDNPLLQARNVVFTPHLGASTTEAQVNVAVDVARGVIAGLRGEPVANAVNLSAVPEHVLEFIRPYLNLAEKMGILAIHLADGRIDNVTVSYCGEIAEVDTSLLTVAVLKGLLNPILQEPVNYVNAMAKARQRGLRIREIRDEEAESFANLVTVKVKTEKREHVVSGTLFGKNEARIVSVDGYGVDFAPEGWILLCPHDDKPGMIGKMGTILGEHGINIASMMVGRTPERGRNMMAMSVERDIPTALMIKIKGMEGILGARLIDFSAK